MRSKTRIIHVKNGKMKDGSLYNGSIFVRYPGKGPLKPEMLVAAGYVQAPSRRKKHRHDP